MSHCQYHSWLLETVIASPRRPALILIGPQAQNTSQSQIVQSIKLFNSSPRVVLLLSIVGLFLLILTKVFSLFEILSNQKAVMLFVLVYKKQN